MRKKTQPGAAVTLQTLVQLLDLRLTKAEYSRTRLRLLERHFLALILVLIMLLSLRLLALLHLESLKELELGLRRLSHAVLANEDAVRGVSASYSCQ